MSTADLTAPEFTNEDAAREALEGVRWANGVFCPHCGSFDSVVRLGGKAGEEGRWHCRDCRKKFTVTVGTVYERSHIPLHKWLLATHLMASSKKGISAHQLHRMLGITYKSAWFMAHRIREAMTDTDTTPVGGAGKPVEVDEVYIGPTTYSPNKVGEMRPDRGMKGKRKVVTLVERGGKACSYHVQRVTAENIGEILNRHVRPDTRLMTDEGKYYREPGKEFFMHERVNHKAKEYVRGDVYTNTVEGFFSIFKRGLNGVYQHVSEAHLQRYLTEFDFRYSNRVKLGVDDKERAAKALKGAEGKRLTYRRINEPQAPSLG
jgi:transposase-like protein